MDYRNFFYNSKETPSILLIGGEEEETKPLVTIIMPVYNHPDFFEKSLESAVNQRCDFDYEILVVDNNHPDCHKKNLEIAKSFSTKRIHYYLNEKNIGGLGNFNRGIELSRGEYVTFCHDDDILYEDALQTLIDTHKTLPSADSAIYGNFCIIDGNDCILHREQEWDSLFMKKKKIYKINMYDFLEGNYTNGCGALYKKSNLINLGGYCGDYSPCTDYALNVLYSLTFGSYALKKETFKYRVSSQGDTSQVYNKMLIAGEKIKRAIMESGKISRCFPTIILTANLKVERYHLFNKWDKNKPSKAKFFLYRIINRLFYNTLLISRTLR